MRITIAVRRERYRHITYDRWETKVYDEGSLVWFQDGYLHQRFGSRAIGGAAVLGAEGAVAQYQAGLLHDVRGCAHVFSNGNRQWYRHGKRYRQDGPTVHYDHLAQGGRSLL